MTKTLLNSTEAAARIKLSAKAFNELLYKKKIINKRGRPSRKSPNVYKPYWELLELKYGKNFKDNHGGNSFKLYENMLETLFTAVGVGSLLSPAVEPRVEKNENKKRVM